MSRFVSTIFGNDGLSVTIWDEAGNITECYNLSDYKGHIDIAKLSKKHPKRKEILEKLEEARLDIIKKKEYKAARLRNTTFDNLKYAFYISCNHRNHTIFIDECENASSKISGYTISEELFNEAVRLGIPIVDNRTIPDDKIHGVTRFPMVGSRPDDCDLPPYSAMSFAPIPVVAALYESLGATLHNITPDYEGAKQATGWTAKEKAVYNSFVTGDNMAFSNALAMENK